MLGCWELIWMSRLQNYHGGGGLRGRLRVKVNVDQNQVGLFMSKSLSQVEKKRLHMFLCRNGLIFAPKPSLLLPYAVTHHRSAKNIDISATAAASVVTVSTGMPLECNGPVRMYQSIPSRRPDNTSLCSKLPV